MTWALKRQIFYAAVFIIILALFGYFVVYPKLVRTPTCTDNRQNGDETGVDCGGMCARACLFEADKISILWSRAFEVVPGRYNAVAYIENKNQDKAVSKIKYSFRFADKDNIYIGKREGETTIPPAGKFAIFEPAIDTGNSVPVFTTFEFSEEPVWIKVPQEKINQLRVSVSDIKLQGEALEPRLSAKVRNSSLFNISDIGVVAILYDQLGNATTVSRTYLDELPPETTKEINFTWPQPFSDTVVAKEIIPIYNIFATKLQ